MKRKLSNQLISAIICLYLTGCSSNTVIQHKYQSYLAEHKEALTKLKDFASSAPNGTIYDSSNIPPQQGKLMQGSKIIFIKAEESFSGVPRSVILAPENLTYFQPGRTQICYFETPPPRYGKTIDSAPIVPISNGNPIKLIKLEENWYLRIIQ